MPPSDTLIVFATQGNTKLLRPEDLATTELQSC